MGSLALLLMLSLLPGTAALDDDSTAGVLVSPTDSSLFFSKHNWAMQPDPATGATVAVSVNSGAYIKAVFSGSTRASFALEPTKPGATATHYMNVPTPGNHHTSKSFNLPLVLGLFLTYMFPGVGSFLNRQHGFYRGAHLRKYDRSGRLRYQFAPFELAFSPADFPPLIFCANVA